MCGIVGKLNAVTGEPVDQAEIRRMLAMIRHRGPDEFGIYLNGPVGLGNARLSIVDLGGGQQPISNQDESLWIVFNGEIFNHIELRHELEVLGHRFTTHSDTEVLLHMYEEFGHRCLDRLNGQFSFAIWNARDQTLFLARDRLGVRPLFYTRAGDSLIFGSEIKALLADPQVHARIDSTTLDQIFSFWSPLSPRTIFQDIVELPPGHYLTAGAGGSSRDSVAIHPYWQPDFRSSSDTNTSSNLPACLDEFEATLVDAVKIRLRADVPVGAYLSGGLDSSIIAAIVRGSTSNHLDTFSIAFSDTQFDESDFQQKMARFLGTDHQVIRAAHSDIGEVFPDVIWHTEIPIMRTSPAPMFLLSRLARDSGYKVVLTGEGADEFLGGYDIFKEAKVRRFWARQPASRWRQHLFQRLYADIAGLSKSSPAMLAAFFSEGLTDMNSAAYSHVVRWRNNRRACRFFSDGLKADLAESPSSALEQIVYPPQFSRWGKLEQAQFLEISIFMSQYLLSSQGDRMGMAHSIEGRFPFLDHRVVNFCSNLPSNLKLRGLTEKFLLKQLGRKWLPAEIWQRPKRPYRAPIHKSFFNATTPDYVHDLLSADRLRETGLFDPAAVGRLVQKIQQGSAIGESDDMALVGIISTQLVHSQFVRNFRNPPPLGGSDNVKVRTQPRFSAASPPRATMR